MKRKMLMFGLAAVLATASVTTSFGANFADINDVPWEGAKTYINEVADKGIMVGDEDIKTGKKVFRAKDKVTLCETTQLAYSLLKNTGNLKSTDGLISKWSPVLTSYKIPAWAHEAVAYSLENQILSLSDVSKFMKDGSISNNATREGVAVIFGKALSAMNTINSGAALSFADKENVAATSVPYVDLLARLNILVGDDENKFNPKNYINRAEMAVIASKTNTILGGKTTTDTSQTARGTVVKVEDMGQNNMITVLSNGSNIGFIGDNTVPTTKEDGTAYSFKNIGKGDVITVVYEGATIKKVTVNSVSQINSTVASVEGTIDEVTNERIYINKSTGGMADYILATDVEITIDGDKSSLKDLFDADEEGLVEVVVSLNGTGKVSKIEATKSTKGDITGTLKEIDNNFITIRKNGSNKDYDFAKKYELKLDGSKATIKEIQKELDDDELLEVTLYLNSDKEITKALVEYSDSSDAYDVIGTIRSIDKTEIRVKTKDGTETYEIADDVDYKLDNKIVKRTDIADAVEDDDYDSIYVKIMLNNKDKATSIHASTKETDVEYDIKGELYDLTASVVDIKPTNKSRKEYTLSDDITYKLDGKKATRREVLNAIEKYDTVIGMLTLDKNDEVITLYATTDDSEGDYEGVIYELSSSYIDIKLKGKSRKDYDLADSVTYKLDGESSTRSKIAAKANSDDYTVNAVITLNSDNEVTKIVATTETDGDVNGTIRSMTTSVIRVELKNGDTEKYDFAPSVDYVLDNKSSSYNSVSKAVADYSIVSVSLTLDSKDRVKKVVASTNAKVSYDTKVTGYLRGVYNDRISMRKSNDDTASYYFANSVVYVLNGTASNHSKLETAFKDSQRVNVTIYLDSDDEIVKIEASTKATDVDEVETVEGEALYVTSGKICVKGEDDLFPVMGDAVITINGSTSTLEEIEKSLNRQDRIDVILSLNSNGFVTKIVADRS